MPDWWLILLAIIPISWILQLILKEAIERQDNRWQKAFRDARAALLTDGGADLPTLDPARHAYRPVSGEALLAIQTGAALRQMKRTGRARTGSATVGFTPVKGLRLRAGSHSISTQKELTTVDTGRLVLTTAAIAFEGAEGGERLTWAQIASATIGKDGITIARRSGPQRIYAVSRLDPAFAATFDIMMDASAG